MLPGLFFAHLPQQQPTFDELLWPHFFFPFQLLKLEKNLLVSTDRKIPSEMMDRELVK
jgi:hypothetical protein